MLRDRNFIDDHGLFGDNKIAMQLGDYMDLSPQLSPSIIFCNNTTAMTTTTPNKHPQKASKSIDLYNHLSHVDAPSYKNRQEASFEGKRGKAKQMSTLIKSIQQIQQQSRYREQNSIKQAKQQVGRRVGLDLMRLKDKSFKLQKNIFNIAIGEVASRQAYISSLHQQIAELKQRIKSLQDQEITRMAHKTIEDSFKIMENKQQLQKEQKRPICGRFYNKNSSPIFNRGSTPNHQRGNSPNSQRIQTASKQRRMAQTQKVKSISQYRVKQKVSKHAIDSFHQHAEDKTQMKQIVRQRQDNGQFAVNEQNEQLKQIFLDNPLWEITSIHDDFRTKISRKLQIPSQFPLAPPDPTDQLQSFQLKAHQIYKLFKIDLKKCKQKVIARKFKNGVFYQLRPNKNIVWYFDGSFYLGDWDNQLSNDMEKNGFGFEYVPNKYYYLGRFSNGVRSGMGTIKIINRRNNREFMAYDGQWFKGKPHGFGKQIDENGNKYIGNFENGEKSGKAVMLGKDGVYYEGEVKNGLKQGKGIQKLANGDVYTGSFSQGKFNGTGTYRWNNGSIFQGNFIKGKREGKGIWKSCNGDQFEGEYHDDLKHGWGKFTWKNGQIYEGQFRNDFRHGEGYYKHLKGKVAKYLWKQGHIEHRLDDKKEEEIKDLQK